MPQGANDALAWVINHFDNLGPDAANSFLGDTYGARESDVIRDLPNKLEAYDCDVVISGNAG